jgi:hypothetical protein
MSSHDKRSDASPLDRLIRQNLRRETDRHQPSPDARRRILQRAAARNAAHWTNLLFSNRLFTSEVPYGRIDLGWRELAFAQAMRPIGLFGSLAPFMR